MQLSVNQLSGSDLPYKVSAASKNPQLLVLCVAAKKQGIKHGTWIEALNNPIEMKQNIKYILSRSPIKHSSEFEFAMTDNFEGIKIKPNTPIKQAAQLGYAVHQWGKPFVLFTQLFHNVDDPDVYKDFKRVYVGYYTSAESFVINTLQSENFHGHMKKNHLTWEHINLEKIVQAWFESDNAIYRGITDKTENRFYAFKRETDS